jgi:predicted ATP-dependent endonuclease of OLD family
MIIYLNNFRGFTDKFIEIKKLNILVGENSTGKSSLLGIVSLLSSPEFLINSQFKNDYVDLGPFDEIICKSSTNPKEIHIGLIKEGDLTVYDTNLPFDGIHMTFFSNKGYSELQHYIIIKKNSVLKIKFEEDNLKVYFKKVLTGVEEYKKLFSSWKDSSEFDKDVTSIGEIKHDKNINSFLKRYPLGILMILNQSKIEAPEELKKFIKHAAYPLFSQELLANTICLAPIRTTPKRIYEAEKIKFSSDGTHIPSVLREILDEEKQSNKVVISELEKFGKKTGLFDKISIGRFNKELPLSPFYINIEFYKKSYKISNVGYGVSQILPILTEILLHDKKSTFLIQQPEIHLHPRSQAYFGTFIFEQFKKHEKSFFIETHSDFLINRIRLHIRKSKEKGIEKAFNLLFFENTKLGNNITSIPIDKNGDYGIDQPKKFREFFLKEEIDFLGF